MDPVNVRLIWSLVLAAQVMGLGSAWLARRSEGSSLQARSQKLFFVSLLAVGAATIVAMGLGPGCWLSSGTTFSLMVLVATYDFRGDTEVEVETC